MADSRRWAVGCITPVGILDWASADKFGVSMKKRMKIEHAASWVSNLERACSFYERWFKATKGPKYSSTKRPFTSYFLSLRLIEEMRAAGVPIVSGPRLTGDGYYEAVIIDSEGILVEITP
jgi:lactoylglutathione lyase